MVRGLDGSPSLRASIRVIVTLIIATPRPISHYEERCSPLIPVSGILCTHHPPFNPANGTSSRVYRTHAAQVSACSCAVSPPPYHLNSLVVYTLSAIPYLTLLENTVLTPGEARLPEPLLRQCIITGMAIVRFRRATFASNHPSACLRLHGRPV